jgi:hypothetical protein
VDGGWIVCRDATTIYAEPVQQTGAHPFLSYLDERTASTLADRAADVVVMGLPETYRACNGVYLMVRAEGNDDYPVFARR